MQEQVKTIRPYQLEEVGGIDCKEIKDTVEIASELQFLQVSEVQAQRVRVYVLILITSPKETNI